MIDDLDSLLPLESRGAELLVAQTDLCPALVIRMRSNRVRLFADLETWGLAGPRWAAIPTADGVTILGARSTDRSFPGSRQTEPWLLCWFEGGHGWDQLRYGQPCHWRGRHPESPFPHIDVPWLIVLQQRADQIELGADGLALKFAESSGHIVAMPLFGADLPAAETTNAWREGLPGPIVERCRRWTAFLRNIPVNCHEWFLIDDQNDTVTIKQVFDYLRIEDDWQTHPVTVAPYPPFALLAARHGFPVSFEEKPGDEEIATLSGPYGFRRDAQSASYTLHGLLRYIHQDEIYPNAPCSPVAQRAVARLQRAIARDPRLAVKTSGGFTRGWALALTSYSHAMRYLTDKQRQTVAPVMEELVGRILDPSHYLPLTRYATAHDGHPVGEAICQQIRDAYKVVQANFFGLWAASQARGNWTRIAQAWPLIRRWFHLPFQTQWLTALPTRWEGLDITRALFDGTVGFARLAARVGAVEDYRAACYLFAKTCAGWFAMEHMPRYHREHRPWLINTDADYLVWHPCRLNGYAAIANDHLLPSEDPKIDGRGWASAYGRMTSSAARFWRDFLRERADEVLNRLLPRCRPDWAKAGAPAVMRAYVLGETAEQLEQHGDANDAAGKAARANSFRLRTYRLFQSVPILREVAAIEAGAKAEAVPVTPPVPAMTNPAEGASRAACRTDQATFPARIASADEGAFPPLLYWPGVRAPKKPFVVLDERLDVLPFGKIEGESAQDGRPLSGETLHPNWCLTAVAHHGMPIESVAAQRQADGSFVVSWETPQPAGSILQFWRHDLATPNPDIQTSEETNLVREHRLATPPLPSDELYWFRLLSFDASGRLHRSRAAALPTARTNWALGCAAYAPRRFPFKEFKYAADRDLWLDKYHRRPPQWVLLEPPHELTNGVGLRPGVEPWIRHAEPDPNYVHWIAVDLGQPRPIDEVVIAHDPEWISAGYRIEAGPPDQPWSATLAGAASTAWTDLMAEETANRTAIARHRFPCRTTRWLRILFTRPAPLGLSANRVLLWGIESLGLSEF